MSKERDYTKLKALLESQEQFPMRYLHKFIGRNSPEFAAAIAEFEKRFPKVRLQQSRTSKGDAHLALTYIFEADNADEIIVLIQQTHLIQDVMVIL